MEHEVITDYLSRLHLKGMLNTFISEAKNRHEMTSDEWILFIVKLLEAELAHRQARSYAYRLELARLPQIKTLDDFDVSNVPIKPEKLTEIKECSFVPAHQNILLVGGSGTGKTHIALALAHKALQKNHRVKFFKFSELARNIVIAQEHRYEARFIGQLLRFNLLIIDEFGYLPIDQKAGALLFELFSGLYEKGSIIITTHLAFDEWPQMFVNKKLTKAVIDRITHHCHILETGNESWRVKEVLKDK